MAKTMWIIDKDYITQPGETGYGVGVASVHYNEELFNQGVKHRFRLLDDDGELYYEGDCNNNSSFSPLDNFGTPNAGAVVIQYKNKQTGKWEEL